jgi:hypothetical protein
MDQSGPAGEPGTPPPVNWAAPTLPDAPTPPAKGFNIQDFAYFRYLITPASITVIYIIGAVLITFAALASAIGGQVLAGVGILLFGNLYWRIICEFIMVLFRMNDALQSINRRGKGM